jgi:hypothetical protein
MARSSERAILILFYYDTISFNFIGLLHYYAESRKRNKEMNKYIKYTLIGIIALIIITFLGWAIYTFMLWLVMQTVLAVCELITNIVILLG